MTDLERLKLLRETIIEAHQNASIDGACTTARELASQALDGEDGFRQVFETLVSAMEVVGQRFKAGECYLPAVILAGKVAKAVLNVLQPKVEASHRDAMPKILIGTVWGDLHDIGKNIVATMLQGAGFQVIDLGVDVPRDKFIAQAQHDEVQLICLGALLTTTLHEMEKTVRALREADISAKIMVGGGPVTQEFADRIKADGYAPDAVTAVERARQLLAEAGHVIWRPPESEDSLTG